NVKLIWDELAETYDKIDRSLIFNLHDKINIISQNRSKLSHYYHNLNSIWREYDDMVQLTVCTCDGASSYKDHAQLLKLMQFVIGLDDIYAPIRSTLLTTEPLPNVKEDFSLLSKDESDNKGNSSSFVKRPMDNKKKFNNNNNDINPNLVCTNCNMTGHTIKRCLELIGYPPNFKKKNNSGQNRLMSLLSDSDPSSSSSQSNMADVSHLDIIGAHPNGTKAKVNQIRSCKPMIILQSVNILVVPRILFLSHVRNGSEKDGLFFLNLGNKIYNSNIKSCHVSKCLYHKKLGHAADQVLSVLKNDINLMRDFSSKPCESNVGSNEHSNVGGPRRSSRKYVLPNKYNDFVLNKKAKYGLDKVVTYSNLSSDKFSFVTNLNKTTKPKSYKEAALDPKWIEAMNSEMEALNKNKTWIITDLP
nr:hypothetical protein [Tanacetum cinerariifolium]